MTKKETEDIKKEAEEKEVNSTANAKTTKKTTKKSTKKSKSTSNKEVEELGNKLIELNDKYMRLSAEFDNYRKRTLKEKSELIKNAGEDLITNLLPVLDDFERALKSMESSEDMNAFCEGVILIYNKFKDSLTQKGLKEIEATGQEFDTDVHEAVTKIPAPEESLKGKVVDVIEKGYYLNDKVIRFSKVVVGE